MPDKSDRWRLKAIEGGVSKLQKGQDPALQAKLGAIKEELFIVSTKGQTVLTHASEVLFGLTKKEQEVLSVWNVFSNLDYGVRHSYTAFVFICTIICHSHKKTTDL